MSERGLPRAHGPPERTYPFHCWPGIKDQEGGYLPTLGICRVPTTRVYASLQLPSRCTSLVHAQLMPGLSVVAVLGGAGMCRFDRGVEGGWEGPREPLGVSLLATFSQEWRVTGARRASSYPFHCLGEKEPLKVLSRL